MSNIPKMEVLDGEVVLLGTTYTHGAFKTTMTIDRAVYSCEWSQYYDVLWIIEQRNSHFGPRSFKFIHKIDWSKDIIHESRLLETIMSERVKRRFFHGK